MKKIIILSLLAGSLMAESLELRYVIDGDTVQFSKDVRCRVAYIDSPESSFNSKAKKDMRKCSGVDKSEMVEAGRYAKRYLKSIMRKGKRYQVNILSREKHRKGSKNRFICEIFDKEESINEKLVRNGFAVPWWRYIKNKEVNKRMYAHFAHAKSNHKGAWRTSPAAMECIQK